MSWKSLLPAAITATLLLPGATRAQEVGPAFDGSAGARVEVADGGFQLITHGIWSEATTVATSRERARSPKLQTRIKPRTEHSNFRRAIYLPRVYVAEAKLGLPVGLLDALIWTESRYNPFAVSRAGAAGLGQLMPGTARELGVLNRFDPEASVWGAARYLRQQLDRFGLVHLAVAAYNAGPRAVERAGGIPINGETPAYVRNVLGYWGKQ